MNVSLGGKPISTEKLRQLGFLLVNLATAVDRYHLQAQQAKANPTDKEQGEAERAASRAFDALRVVRRVIAEVTT